MAILSGGHAARWRGDKFSRALVFATAALVWSLVVGPAPAAAQQCPNSATNCNVTSGTLVINTSPNTYTGTTNVSSGAELDIVSGGALNGAGTLTNNGTLSIGAGGAGSFSNGANIGTVAGTSSVTVSGAGALLQVSGAPNLVFSPVGGANSTMTISNGGSVISNQDYIGESGSTSVTVTGTGSRWTENASQIIGDNGGTGSLTISNGAVVNVANGSFLGNNAGGVGSVLVTGAGSTYNVANTLHIGVRSVGILTVADGGVVNVTGAIGLNGAAGIINIGAPNGQTAAAPGTINDNGTGIFMGNAGSSIVFNHTSSNYTFSPVLIGAGSVVVDAGTTIFAVTENYTGNTTINGGTLEVDGSIASSPIVTVNAGGKLAGTGIVDPPVPVGTTTINNGGTLAPGNAANPTGTLTIGGSLAFQSGAIYLVQINAAVQASKVNVVGSATLGGATVQVQFAPGVYSKGQSFNILTATGGTVGQFSGASFVPPNYAGSLSYPTDNVLLTITGATLGNGLALNPNQQGVANALNTFFNGGGTLTPQFGAIFGLSGPALASALTQLSGEAATDAQAGAFELTNQFLNLMIDPFTEGRGGSGAGGAIGFAPDRADNLPAEIAQAYASVFKAQPAAAPLQTWNVWGSAYGGGANVSGDVLAGTSDVTARTFGYVSGADYRITRDTLIGFAIGGGGTNWSVANGLGGGRSDAFQAGVYAKTFWGPAYVAASLGFADHWMTTNRVSALFDQLTASFNAQSYGGRVEGGYRFAVSPASGITPYAAVQAQSFHTPFYQETDVTGGGFGLAFNARNATDTRSEIGSRFDQLATVGAYLLTLHGRLAWAHDWVSDPSLGAVFQALPGASFIVNGATPAHDYALTTFGADLHLTPHWVLSAKFEGELAARTQSYSGLGKVAYSW